MGRGCCPARERSARYHEPEREKELTDSRERGDIRPGASGKHTADTVDQIANTRDGKQDTQKPGDIARPVCQVGNDKQIKAEEDETGVPNIGEGIDSQ
jgi:hypothetical protein